MEYVLITGATSGIGYALAEVFAAKGYSLILVGRNTEKLEKTKEAMLEVMRRKGEDKNNSGALIENKIVLITQDLSTQDAAKNIYEAVIKENIKVGILINNAGAGYAGAFWKASDEKIMELMALNMTQLTLLTKYFSREMKEARKGKILNVASTGAYHPGAYIAVYYATKAYVLSLSEALYEELRSYGVVVSSLCPGATLTGFQKASGREDTKLAMKPGFVANKAYEGLMKNKRVIIPGLRNKLMVRIPKGIGTQLIKRYQKSTLSNNEVL